MTQDALQLYPYGSSGRQRVNGRHSAADCDILWCTLLSHCIISLYLA